MFFKTLVKLRSLTIYLLSCLILLTSCDSKTNDNGNKISNVIYDGFLDIYDLIGVYITAVDPNLNLIAVTPSGAYFHYYEDAAVNAKKVLMAANKPQVPVSSERAIPICPPKKESSAAPFVESTDNLYLPPSPYQPEPISGEDLIIKEVNGSNQKVSLICVGSLNNIARALKKDPSLKERIDEIVISTASIHTKKRIVLPFNPNFLESSKYDIYVDPCSANAILELKIPVKIVPIEICALVNLTEDVFNHYKNENNNFIYQVLKEGLAKEEHKRKFTTFWDIVLVFSVSDPTIMTYETQKIKIIETEGLGFAQIVPDDTGYEVEVCVDVDSDKFYERFFSLINELK